MQSLLNLFATPGITLLWLVVSVVYSLFSAQWREVFLIATVKTVLQGILMLGLVKDAMQKVFSLGMKGLKKKFNYKGIVVVPK